MRAAGKAAALTVVSIFCVLSFAAPVLGGDSAPRWGLTARGGTYGLPDWLLDLLFEDHPSVDGHIVGGEIRYYGEGGPSGVFSVALAVDVGQTDGTGIWRENEGDDPVSGGGGVDIVAGTVTLYWDLWPSAALHPYIGIGLGVGYADGFFEREGERVQVDEYVPVVHLPVGLIVNLGQHLGIGVEGRIIDGISWGGLLQARF